MPRTSTQKSPNPGKPVRKPAKRSMPIVIPPPASAVRQTYPALQTHSVVDQLAALHTIQKVAQSFSSELDLETLLRKVLRAALDIVDATAGSLLLYDAASDELRFEVLEGGGEEYLKGRRMPSNQGIAGWAFNHGVPLVVPDASKDERFYKDFDKSSGFQTTSLIALPLIIAGKKIGVLEVLNKRNGGPFVNSDADLLTVLAAQSAIAIENARLYHHLWSERNRILTVEEEVRRELAREVHDGPAQLISALVMNVRFVKTLLEEKSYDLMPQEMASMEELATRALRQMRELLFNQRPLVLETQGLMPALETYVARLVEAGELDIKLEMDAGSVKLPGKADRTAFSIVTEAVGNARKHAPNSHVRMRVAHNARELTIVIIDDGPGFDVERTRATYDKRGSLGLLNMIERTQQIGGTLTIDSVPGHGTTVSLRVPLNAEAHTLNPL
jgi:signal transduction histidine kinase